MIILIGGSAGASGVEEAKTARREAYQRYIKEVKKYPATTQANRQKRKELYKQIMGPAVKNYRRSVGQSWKEAGSKGVKPFAGRLGRGSASDDEGSEGGSAFESSEGRAGGGGKSIKNTESLDGSGIKSEIHFKKPAKSSPKKSK